MKKIFGHYILNENEMDRINYLLDFYRKYKIMAELNWDTPEGQADEETSVDTL